MKKGEIIRVGEKIKKTREEAGTSLRELSEKTGYSESILSQIENHFISPPLGALLTISRALGTNVGMLLDETKEEPFVIVRKGEEQAVSRVASKEGVNYGYMYRSLGAGKKDRHFEPFLITLEPTTIRQEGLSVHDGEEFIYVLSGAMEVQLRDFKEVLRAGDSIFYDSSIPHRVNCDGSETATILAVIWSAGEPQRH